MNVINESPALARLLFFCYRASNVRYFTEVLIPINMRDGSILAVGKGNPEWNYSAPHGAGHLMSRTRAVNELSMDDYVKAMDGIYSTSINERTLDEAPMAYKSLEDIVDVIDDTVVYWSYYSMPPS